jgi:hypothetical protein
VTQHEELRDEAGEVWGLLDELLLHAEANGDEAVLTLLLEAETAVLRLDRVLGGRERRHHGRRPLSAGELALLLRRLDRMAGMVPAGDGAALLATAQACVAQVGELVVRR